MLTLLMAVAGAQTLGQLPYGAHDDLSACMEGGGTACARAATYLGAPWSAPLTAWATNGTAPQPAASLSSEMALQQALISCILTADLCEEAATRLDTPATRMEATFLHLEACREGNEASCADLGLSSSTRQGAAGLTAQQQENWRIAPGFVPPAELTAQLIQTCDGTNAPAAHDACLTLAAVGNGLRGKPERHTQFMNVLRVACSDGSPAACSVVSGWEEHEVPAILALSTTYPLLRNLCHNGTVGAACEVAARALELGRPVAYGTQESLRLHGYACDDDITEGCKSLDRAYNTPYVSAETKHLCELRQSGRGGDGRACTGLASQLMFGVGRDKDLQASEALSQQACTLGDYRVCLWDANAKSSSDPPAAIQLYKKACAAGDAPSCATVGGAQVWGAAGLTKSADGLSGLQKGCDSLHGESCHDLGVSLYDPGSAAKQDLPAAYRAFDRSCALGDQRGCSYLGGMKLFEQGTSRDTQGGLWLLNRGCADGFASSCLILGKAYLEGATVSDVKDLPRARHTFQRGCALGDEESCTQLEGIGEGESTAAHEGTRPANTALTSAAAESKRTIITGSYRAPWDVQQAVADAEPQEEVTIKKRPHPTVQGFLVRDLGGSGLGQQGSFGLQVSHGFKGFSWGVQFLREDWGFDAIDTLELTVDRGLFYRGFAHNKLVAGASAYASAGYVLGEDNSLGASVGVEVSLGVHISNPLSFSLFWRPVKPFAYGDGTNNELYLQAVRQDIGLSYTF